MASRAVCSVDNQGGRGDTTHTVRAEKSIVRKSIIREIERRIYTVRGRQVMPDSDLAHLYGIRTKALIQAIKRNPKKFPPDFSFQMTWEEYRSLRSQNVTLDKGRGKHRKYPPYVFTEHGAAALSGVLRSDRADEMYVLIMRAFVRMRRAVATGEALTMLIRELSKKVGSHGKTLRKHQEAIAAIVEALNRLMNPPQTPVVGFMAEHAAARTPETRGRPGRR